MTYNMTMKIVVDTNILVAALISSNGVSNRLLIWLFEHQDKYCVVSNTLVTEYEDVLLRQKSRKMYTQLSQRDLQLLIDDICLISYHQKINFLWRPFLRDIKDDMVLETAFNANCNYIVTYNNKDFQGVEDKFGIKIITPKEFLYLVGDLK